jgi:hypothetical protein
MISGQSVGCCHCPLACRIKPTSGTPLRKPMPCSETKPSIVGQRPGTPKMPKDAFHARPVIAWSQQGSPCVWSISTPIRRGSSPADGGRMNRAGLWQLLEKPSVAPANCRNTVHTVSIQTQELPLLSPPGAHSQTDDCADYIQYVVGEHQWRLADRRRNLEIYCRGILDIHVGHVE